MKTPPLRIKRQSGFSLIELLVAMFVLLIVVLVCAQIFQQARVAWASGQDVVDMNMTGRAVVDCISRELSMAVADGAAEIKAQAITFTKLGDTSTSVPALQSISYSMAGGYLTRNGEKICPGVGAANPRPGISDLAFSPVTNGLPDYVDIEVTVGFQSSATISKYQARVYFYNRKRFELP